MVSINYWHKQTLDNPLYPDLLWSRPENKQLAGKLLVIGGNAYEFAAPAEAYNEALRAGVGAVRVLLPQALKHTIGAVIEAGDFAPSTPSGSFSQKALQEFYIHSDWADGVLLAGDLGRNSETAIVLEKFAGTYRGQLTLTKDAADYGIASPQSLLKRQDTTLVLTIAQLQKLGTALHLPKAFTFGMDLLRLVEALHYITYQFDINLIVKQQDYSVVASSGKVSTTKLAVENEYWRIKLAANASVWWLQNPSKIFESLSTAVYQTFQR